MVVDDDGEVEFRTTSDEDFDSFTIAEAIGVGGDRTVEAATRANLSSTVRLLF